MVGKEENRRIIFPSQLLDALHQDAEPAVDHGDLAAIASVGDLQLALRHAVVFPIPVTGVDVLALIFGVIGRDVMSGRIPGFVRVPGIDVEEEGLRLVIPLQPTHGRLEGLRRKTILFARPLGDDVVAVLPLALPADPDVLLEATVVAVAVADHEGIVGDAAGGITGMVQDLGQGRFFWPQRPPIAIGESVAPGGEIGARRHRGERGGVEIIEDDAAFAKGL